MSEIKLKRCPCCDGEALLCDPLKEEAFIYIPQVICSNCGLEVTSHTVESVVEKWNTRKPMQEMLRRLEEDIEGNTGASLGSYRAGLYKAIEIVKEVGGVNERD